MQVPRSIPVFTRAFTWLSFTTWTVSIPVMAQTLYQRTDNAVETFAKEYHEQNPK